MVAFELPPGRIGHLTAAADYTSSQFLAINQTSNTAATVASTAGQRCTGLLQNNPASGEACDIITEGVGIGTYGGTVSAGDDLVVNASGQLVSASAAGSVVGGQVIARALYSGVSGDQHAVWVNPPAVRRPQQLRFTVTLASIAGDRDIVTEFPIGAIFGAGRILRFDAVVMVAGAGAGSIAFNLEIGTTNVTGGVVTATLAAATAGAVLAGTAITAGNAFGATDTLSIEADHTADFSAGQVDLIVTLA